MSAKEEILKVLQFSPTPKAVHEFGIIGYNENNLATRCSELAAEGKIEGRIRKGFNYKEWYLAKRERNGQGLLF